MVGYATMSGYTNQIANGSYSSQLAKLQAFQNILTVDYKWSHREMKQLLIDIIETFDSINGSSGASSSGIDINNPDSWKDNDSGNDNGSNNDSGNGNSSNNNNVVTEEQILELLKKYADQISPTIDITKIVKEAQDGIISSKLFRDLVSQLIGNSIDGITQSIADEEHARVEADADVLKKTSEKIANEAKERVDAIANEAAIRAQQFAEEAAQRNEAILDESKARIAADEKEIAARTAALDKEAKTRQAELSKLSENLQNHITTTISESLKTETDARVDAIKKASNTAQTNLLNKAKEIGTAITNVETKLNNNTTRIQTLTISSQKALAGIEEEKAARIAGDTAESKARTTLAAQLRGEISSGINTERQARVTDKEAQAIVNEQINSKIGNVESSLTSESRTRVSADEALSSRITDMTTKVDNAESKIRTLETTSASSNAAMAKRIDKISADIVTATGAVSSSLDEFKKSQATKDAAQTEEINSAKTKIDQNESAISEIRRTTVTKTEVSTIAKTALESAWKGDISKSAETSLVEATKIANQKASEAQAAAERAAQTKADAAKAAAIAAAKGDAQTKANAAKAAAIADAAAKDAIIKQQAAADAQSKANAALASAKTYSDGLVRDANAKIDRLSETVTQKDSARASELTTLNSKLNALNIGGRNLLLNSKQTYIAVAHTAANNERYSKRVEIAKGINWSEVRSLVLSVDMKHAGDLTQAGSRWWRTGLEIRLEFESGETYWPKVIVEAPQTVAQNKRISYVYNIPANKVVRSVHYASLLIQNVDSSEDIVVSNPKLEIGNIATAWTPAPEDIEDVVVNVESKITELNTTIADKERALGERITNINSTFNSNISNLQLEYRTLSEKDSSLTQQLTNLTSKVNNNESAIRNETTARTNQDNAIAKQITDLTAKYNAANATLKNEAKLRADADDAIIATNRELNTKFETANSRIATEETARTNADKALSSRIDTLSSGIKNSDAAIKTLSDTYATDKRANASRLAAVESKVEDSSSKITQLATTVNTKESALSQQINALNSEIGKNKASIAAESKARADEKTAQAAENRAIKASIADAESHIVAERDARVSTDAAINKSISGLTSRMGSAEGKIIAEEKTRAAADEALTQKVTQLTSNFNQANSAITTLQSTVTNQNNARAQEISTLSAKLGDMRIGGRNYLRETGNLLDTTMWRFVKHNSQTKTETARQRDMLTITAENNYWAHYAQYSSNNPLLIFEPNDVVTISFEANTTVTTANFIRFFFRQRYTGGISNVSKMFTPTEANKWLKYSYTFVIPTKQVNFTQFDVIFEIISAGTLKIRKMKLERGNVATDWTEAPEDMARINESTAAELTSFKNAQATKDSADTEKLNGAISRIGNAESKISNLETTRANKNEVASLARSTLKAEWDKAVSGAKNTLSGEITETKRVAARANETANSLYTLKVQTEANGKKNIAGIMLGANEADSQVGFVADKFYVASGNFRKTPFIVKENDIFFNGRVNFANENNLIPNPRFILADGDKPAGIGRTSLVSNSTFSQTTQFLTYNTKSNANYVFNVPDGDTEAIIKTRLNKSDAFASIWFDTIEFIFDNKDGIPGKKYTFSALANAHRATCSLLVEEMNPVNKHQFVKQLGKSEEIGINSTKANAPTNGPNFSRGLVTAAAGRRIWCEFTWPSEGAVRISIRGNNIKSANPDIYSARWKLVEGTGDAARKWLADTGTMIDGSTIVSGTINGSHIKARSIISAPYIVGGSLNIADRFKVMSNGDVLIQAAAGNTGMKITSERIDVYDTSGRLRVRMGKLT